MLFVHMHSGQPTERMWSALKSSAAHEKHALSLSQALRRVKAIAAREGACELPDAALRFYAGEYLLMVRK